MKIRPPWKRKAELAEEEKRKEKEKQKSEQLERRRHQESMRWAKAGIILAGFGYVPWSALLGFLTQPLGTISGISYTASILLGVLGVLQIHDHVEDAGHMPLPPSAIILAAGGGLFEIQTVYEAMMKTIGNAELIRAPKINELKFDVQ